MENKFCLFNDKRIFKRFTRLIICVFVAVILASCHLPETNTSQTIPENNSYVEDSSERTISSGTLRLWMQYTESINPLVSEQLQFYQISGLIYESLFSVDENQNIEYSLAEKTIVSEDRKTYDITIRNNAFFHDGSTLRIEDIVYTTEFIMDPENESIYFHLTGNIEDILIKPGNTVSFILSDPDPFFLYNLIYPVLSEDELKNLQTEIFSGTGLYKIHERDISGNINLKLSDFNTSEKSPHIENISITVYDNFRQAMGAFSRDEIDIVVLNHINYEIYHRRNDLNISHFPGNTFLFFEINSENKNTNISNETASIIKKILSNSVYEDLKDDLIYKAVFPFRRTYPLVRNNMFSYNHITPEEMDKISNELNEILIVCSEEDKLTGMIAEKTKEYFAGKGIGSYILYADEEQYRDYIEEKKFDVIIRSAVTGYNPDPSWLYLDDPFNRVENSDTITGIKNIVYRREMSRILKDLYLMEYNILESTELSDLYKTIESNSSVQGIGFAKNAIVAGKRVNGEFSPCTYNIFRNIEDVWIWSGQ